MKRTKPIRYGMQYCQFKGCATKQIPAMWMTSGLISHKEFACDKHKDKLKKPDDGYMTEADYMTWGRL